MQNLIVIMKSIRARTWVAWGITCLMLITSAVLVVGLTRKPNQLRAGQVYNKTSALELVSAVPDQNGIFVTVKNILSDRNITGLVFAVKDVQVQVDLLSGFSDYTISPGKTYSQFLALQTQAGGEASAISILATVLDNRTVNGDVVAGSKLLGRRQGKKEQLQLILPIVKNALDSKLEGAIAQAIANIEKIPHPHDLALDYQIKSGAHAIRELILSKLQDHVSKSDPSSTEGHHALAHTYDEYSRLLPKL